ncbi:MAG: hypothetical protein ABSH22_10625 [Tepidisphaeraceae bacterium]
MSGNVPQLHPTEEAAALTPAAGAGLAALLTSHVLRDGELVLLTLKPSLLFIPLQSLRFAVIAGFFALLGVLANGRIDQGDRLYIEIAVILVACRLMVASLQWMGRLYVLTDQRILDCRAVGRPSPARKKSTPRYWPQSRGRSSRPIRSGGNGRTVDPDAHRQDIAL